MRKKISLFLFLSGLALCIHAQRFQATTGTTNYDDKWAVIDDPAIGAHVAIGNTDIGGQNELWISSYGPGGIVLTSARATNGRRMIARDISLAPPDPNTGNTTYYVTGWTEIFAPGAGFVSQMFVGRIDLNGFFLWYQENPIGGAGNAKEGIAIVTDPATQDAIALGIVQWPGPGPIGPMIILTRFNPLGGILWSNAYVTPGVWMPREIDLGAPPPGCFPPSPDNYIVTGEVNAPPAAVPQTFAAAYTGAGVECWRNTYPAASAVPTMGDAGYDVVLDAATGNYCIVGAAQTGPVRAAATSTPYLLNVNPAGVLLAASVVTTPTGLPLGIYPRTVSPGRNPGQLVMAGPDYGANRTFMGTLPLLGVPLVPGVYFNYAGNATANSFPQPFVLNDVPPEDILFTVVPPTPGYLASTNAVPGPFGVTDGHFIQTDPAFRTPDSCKENRLLARPNPTMQTIAHPHTPNALLAWGKIVTNNNPHPVQQVFCRDTCIVNAGFTFTLSNDTAYFTNSSTGNGTLSYSWNFGDGSPADISVNPIHKYAGSGPYVVCLTVTNNTTAGLTCSATYCDTVRFCSVSAAYTFTKSGQTASFTGAGTGNGTLSYSWTFGDGGTSTLTNPTHTYGGSGPYVACVTVTNITANNDTCTATYCDTVEFCTVSGSYTYTQSGSTVNFSGSGSGNGTISYSWNFGDGNTSTLQNPTHTYTGGGPYNACLTVTNVLTPGDTCRTTVCQTITVCNVKAAFKDSLACKTVYFTSQSTGTGPLTYNWNFGDGTTSTNANPVKAYTVCGNYTVRLITCNAVCCDTVYKTINIPCCTVSADFCLTANGRVATLNITSVNPVGTVDSVYLDGTRVTWASGTNRTLTAGTHTICLRSRRVVCGDTCCATVCKTISVSDTCTLVADYWHQVQTSGAVVFTNKTTPTTAGNIYAWDFGVPGIGTDTSSAASPTYTYTTPGTYTACLTVKRLNGADTCIQRVCKDIIVNPPCKAKAAFRATYCTDSALQVSFVNASTGAITYEWDFGDTTVTTDTSTAVNPSYTYAAPGTYIVCLKAMVNNSCWYKACYKVIVSSVTRSANCKVLPGNPAYRLAEKLPVETEWVGASSSSGNLAEKTEPESPALLFFPNPASQQVNAIFHSEEKTMLNVLLVNAAGAVVYKNTAAVTPGRNRFSIPVTHLPGGLYRARLQVGKRILSGHFVVDNH